VDLVGVSVLLGVATLRILLVLQLVVHDLRFVLWLILLVLALQIISLVLLLRMKLGMDYPFKRGRRGPNRLNYDENRPERTLDMLNFRKYFLYI
jgi:hypothetical protein